MANAPITALYQTGKTVYSVSISNVTGYFFNGTAYEVFAAGHWASEYATVLTEFAGTGIYQGAYPIAAPTQLSTEVIFLQAGGSPAVGDQPITYYQSQGQSVAALANLWVPAQNMAAALGTEQIGAVVGTPTTPLLIPTNLTSTQLDAYAGSSVRMTSGVLVQQTAYITGYDGAGNLTINGFPSGGTPASGDAFIIL